MKGALGEAVFNIAQDQAARIISSMSWSGSTRMEVHNVHNGSAITEYTGMDPDQIELTLIFARELGVDPMTEMARLWGYMRKGEAVPLTVGNKPYGKYRWTITSLQNELQHFDRDGDVRWVEVSVSLQEYLWEAWQ